MTKLITAVLCAGIAMTAAAASDAPKPAAASAASKADAHKARPVEDPMLAKLPAGATKVGPNTWAYTDPQGKKWIYRRTPFTLAKLALADNPEYDRETEVDRRAVEMTTVTDKGDSVQFTRPGPFGMLKWTTKKSDLSPYELRVWERYERKQATSAPAPAGAAASNQE